MGVVVREAMAGWVGGDEGGLMPPWVSALGPGPLGGQGERGSGAALVGRVVVVGVRWPPPGLPSGRAAEDGVAFSPQCLAFLAGSS